MFLKKFVIKFKNVQIKKFELRIKLIQLIQNKNEFIVDYLKQFSNLIKKLTNNNIDVKIITLT